MDSNAVRIVVSPIGRGRYSAWLGDRVLVTSARTPLLDAARVLLAEGLDPATVLEMQHAGSAIVAMRGQSGKLARLTVRESDRDGPAFAPFKPFEHPPHVDGPGMPTNLPAKADFAPPGMEVAKPETAVHAGPPGAIPAKELDDA
jgi:hypothetical protein